MLFWTGWGILALPIAAGAAIWLLGQRLNTPQPGFHPQTGQPVLFVNRHRLWFLPLQWWGPVAAVVGVVVGVQSLLS